MVAQRRYSFTGKTIKIQIKNGVWQGNRIFSGLLDVRLPETFREIDWDEIRTKGKGEYVTNLRPASGIVLLNNPLAA